MATTTTPCLRVVSFPSFDNGGFKVAHKSPCVLNAGFFKYLYQGMVFGSFYDFPEGFRNTFSLPGPREMPCVAALTVRIFQ